MNHNSFRVVSHRALSLIIAAAMVLSLFSITACDESGGGGSVSDSFSSVERRYFGNQLDTENARHFYDKLVEHYVDNEEDVGTITIDLADPLTFDIQLPPDFHGSTFNLGDYETYNEENDRLGRDFYIAFTAFQWDYPECFWVDWYSSLIPSLDGDWSDNNTIYHGRTETIELTTTSFFSDAYENKFIFRSNVNSTAEIVASKAEDNSRYALVKAAHDYIATYGEYDMKSYNAGGDALNLPGNPASFYVGTGKMICQGYSKTFQILCNALDIPCVYVHGLAFDPSLPKGGPHAWNYVQMEDGNWYGLDVTWDDQDTNIYDTYLLVGKKTQCIYYAFEDDHHAEGYHVDSGTGITYDFQYPELSKYSYSGN